MASLFEAYGAIGAVNQSKQMVGPEGGPLVPKINDLAKSGTGFHTSAFHAFSP